MRTCSSPSSSGVKLNYFWTLTTLTRSVTSVCFSPHLGALWPGQVISNEPLSSFRYTVSIPSHCLENRVNFRISAKKGIPWKWQHGYPWVKVRLWGYMKHMSFCWRLERDSTWSLVSGIYFSFVNAGYRKYEMQEQKIDASEKIRLFCWHISCLPESTAPYMLQDLNSPRLWKCLTTLWAIKISQNNSTCCHLRKDAANSPHVHTDAVDVLGIASGHAQPKPRNDTWFTESQGQTEPSKISGARYQTVTTCVSKPQ